MPSFCAVINCSDRYGHSENISFHKFPLKRITLLKQWEAFIQEQRGPDWHASRWSSLCSRHFREDDFRSLNERRTLKKSAVPSIMLKTSIQENSCQNNFNESQQASNNCNNEILEVQGIKEHLEEFGNSIKSHCRLCGITSVPAGTFHSNYKLLRMLQKCLPCVNVQQDDILPKTLCDTCLKTLQNFGNFVDKVLEAQEELQRKYRHRTAEKFLKIKQEPVVRVKQEAAEADNNQESHRNTVNAVTCEDYEFNREQTPEGDTSDQKYELCDFPIMNDCDIMEIINLDDPFINIPDDDNTASLNIECDTPHIPNGIPQTESVTPQHVLSAHDLLQSNLLMEEHNYAYLETEEFKERCFYKTEKTEGYEQNIENHMVIHREVSTLQQQNDVNLNSTNTTHATEQSPLCLKNDNRGLKPIVTSVSAIQQPNKSSGVVVLDESIVKSGTGFQLHACMVCQMKFFSIEALRQHYTQTHGTPMVSVPNVNLQKNSASTCKMENEINEANNKQSPCGASSNNIPDCKNANTANNDITLKADYEKFVKKRRTKIKTKATTKRIKCNLNIMASHYQQLKNLYHKLQKKCLNLEQNVEQLQSQPKDEFRKSEGHVSDSRVHAIKMKTSPRLSRQPKDSKFECTVCLKVFTNSNSLRQHKITHTEERTHICGLCSRSFKRRNGLLQHFKGYHLQVKPFTCGVCKRAYALKCDMLRCKHSVLKSCQP